MPLHNYTGAATEFQLKKGLTHKYPAVEWRKISDFRNVLAHEYFGINFKIMWDIIKNKLPKLMQDIKAIIESENISGDSGNQLK